MTDLSINLPIWPWPLNPAHKSALVAAKSRLGISVTLQPIRAFKDEGFHEWVRQTNSRVLCILDEPPGLCDHALIRNIDNQDAVVAALDWVTSDKDDPRAMTVDKMLSKLIPGIVEQSFESRAYENISKNLKLHHSDKVPIFQPDEDGN